MAPKGAWSEEEKLAFVLKILFTKDPTVNVPKNFQFRDRPDSGMKQQWTAIKKAFLASSDAPGAENSTISDGDNVDDGHVSEAGPAASKVKAKGENDEAAQTTPATKKTGAPRKRKEKAFEDAETSAATAKTNGNGTVEGDEETSVPKPKKPRAKKPKVPKEVRVEEEDEQPECL